MIKRRSGQVTVATAGTAVQCPAESGSVFVLKAHPSNVGTIWVGSDGAGDVTNANGFPLDAGDAIEVRVISSLAEEWVDASNNGDKLCWHVIAY